MARFALTLAMAACLAACASAALPEKFNTTGGPPVLSGGFYIQNTTDFTTAAVGWAQGNNFRLISGAGTDQFTVVDGTYQSWQCVPELPGSYNALISLTTTAADGTKTTKTVCELGVWNGGGFLDLAQSETECPTVPEYTANVLTTDPAEYACAATYDTLPPTETDFPPDVAPPELGEAASPTPSA